MSNKIKFGELNGRNPSFEEIRTRKEHVKKIVIQHPGYKRVIERIEEYHLLSEGSIQPDGIFLSGETGVGKSTLLKEYQNKYPRKMIDGCTKIPILYTKVPVGATPKSVASKILLDLGDPVYDKGTENNQTARLLKFIEKCEVQMVVIDEFQHLIDRETQHVFNRASDWVKSFTDDVGVPVLICGMPESQKIFQHNAQLDRRFCTRLDLKSFEYESKEEQIVFRAFLNNLDHQLPFVCKSYLANPNLSEKLYYASKGIPFYVKKILEEATVHAVRQGRDCLEENDLFLAYQLISISHRPYAINPFGKPNFNLIEEIKKEKYQKK
ncbi:MULTISPECIES: TniB family NTP-binding protein [Bacillus]|uniref:TniB family NTP-binding protein n=1 Tax=Bacillus TaxID=1386 RepID=UPI000BF79513|nr:MULTISPECIES: TniB family NTP-binding protein [Bacillus]MCU5405945.1 TniB family NTP-binding protein [Bacillus cereus]MBG9854679.1 TniB protein [Bacillus wiedmannii]MBY7113721.1 TniB family NTP-binding protein [Bacillus sp. 17RED48]MCU5115246.1 TniB family NTP-binding protein [Bacillus wiedmannii]MCU5154936.1 TniB family NTP-binding protein [Bacillus wiedmannii]